VQAVWETEDAKNKFAATATLVTRRSERRRARPTERVS